MKGFKKGYQEEHNQNGNMGLVLEEGMAPDNLFPIRQYKGNPLKLLITKPKFQQKKWKTNVGKILQIRKKAWKNKPFQGGQKNKVIKRKP